MDELLQKVAEIRGMPASLVERSAKARAKKTDTTLDAVLREWLGEAEALNDDSPDMAEPQARAPQSEDRPHEEEQPQEEVAPSQFTTDELVQLAADAKRMPPKLILTSAEARAQHSGTTLETVLTAWANVDIDERPIETDIAVRSTEPDDDASQGVTPSDDSTQDPTPEPDPQPPPSAPAEAGGMRMDELLEKVAAIKGMPAPLAKRSADARAKKTGETVEAILAEWAGLVPISASVPLPAEVPASTLEHPEASSAPSEDRGSEHETATAVEIIEATVLDDAADESADGRGVNTRSGYPKWLAAAFILIPILAITYILVAPNGPDCGSGGRLRVDPASGEAVNCDGGTYGETTVDNFAAGGAIYAQCAACHSSDGSGGVGPAFAGGAVLATFPSGACSDHIEWVTIGTAGWPQPTYGAGNKPVGGVGLMPGFGSFLSEEQVAQVALFERVQFGGQALEDAEVDCGLVEASAEG